MISLPHITVLLLLAVLQQYLQNNLVFALSTLTLYLFLPYEWQNDNLQHDEIEMYDYQQNIFTISTCKHIFGDILSSLLLMTSLRDKLGPYSFHVMIASFLLKFSHEMFIKNKSQNRTFCDISNFVTFGLTYFFNSGVFACLSMVCIVWRALLDARKIMNIINDVLIFFGKYKLEDSDVNKHMVIWFQLKIFYIACNYFDYLKIYIPAFHLVAGLIFAYYFLSNLTTVRLTGYNTVAQIIIVMSSIILLIINYAMMFRIVLLVSLIVSALINESKKFTLFLLIDVVFVILLINKLIY